MYYFAYGSNMLRERLAARIGPTRQLGHAHLAHHRLTFNKRSKDGSGKCTVVASSNNEDGVWGVLFELSVRQKRILDRFEGKGYEDREIVITQNRVTVRAFTYISLHNWTDHSYRPYSWYKTLVLAGALQSGLPQAYIADIERISCAQDHDDEREGAHYTLISDSGYGHLIAVL